MIDPVLETLFYPLLHGLVPHAGKRAVFMNARLHSFLTEDRFESLSCVQVFKPYVDVLQAHGLSVVDERELVAGACDIALVVLPKNMVEARYLVARALQALAKDGVLICAAGNKAGGGRLVKMLGAFGLDGVSSESRNKSRVAWATATNIDEKAVDAAIAAGAEQDILDDDFVSQPGVFGWDKIDKGSALLLSHVPDDLKGKGADFGCGYGYLSRAVMGLKGGKVKRLHAIDADARAVRLCEQNVEGVIPVWADITAANDLPDRLDFIVMNPPFHEGKLTNSDIGVLFIEQAARCLHKGGVLWMVANVSLPYEAVLERAFYSYERVAQANGFKVFRAVK